MEKRSPKGNLNDEYAKEFMLAAEKLGIQVCLIKEPGQDAKFQGRNVQFSWTEVEPKKKFIRRIRREPQEGKFVFSGARKCHFPRFPGNSFINQNVEKR